jgi:hypothetical protein
MARTITAGDIEAQLAQAARIRATAPRCTPQQLADARAAWGWLALVSERDAAVLQSRAVGASWAAISRHAGVAEGVAKRIHAEALQAIAGRLNRALAP